MAVTRYKLDGNTTAYATGSKTLGATSVSSFPSTPTPPTGLATSASIVAGGKFENATYPNPQDGGGEWFDAYFYKGTGNAFAIGTFSAQYWDYAGETLSVCSTGGVGVHAAGTSVPAYSGFDTSVVSKTANGLLTDGQWHRIRLEFPNGSGTPVAKFFVGSNRHGTTPDATLSLRNFKDAGVFGGQAVYWAYGNGASPNTTWLSDIAYGLAADSPPARSSTDWAGATYTSTAPLDVTVSLTADATVTSATKTSTAPLDVTVSLTADGTTTHPATAPLDVTFSLTAEASTTSDADPTWGTPETWGSLWGWWTTTAPGANDGVVPVGFSLTAEGAAVAPTLSTGTVDVTVTLASDGMADRSEISALELDFTITADAVVIPGSSNAAILSVDLALNAEAMVDTSVPSTLPLTFALVAAGSVYPATDCPDGVVCRPNVGVIDRPGPLD